MKFKTGFLKGALFFISILILVLSVFWLPTVSKELAISNPDYAHLRLPLLLGLYITLIPFYIALYQAFRLLHFIEKQYAFSAASLYSLCVIKNCAVAIVVLYIAGMSYLAFSNALHPGIAVMGAIILFACISIALLSMLLHELLRSGLNLKTENELTI